MTGSHPDAQDLHAEHLPPRKAIVLAAGFGSRLLPLTRQRPKPLIPFWGEPMLGRTLRILQEWGVKEVLINLHHGMAQIVQEVPKLCPPGLRVQFSFEPEILGTGGCLRRMSWFFDDGPLWMANADVVMRLKPHSLVRRHQATQPLATLWMEPRQGPRTVSLNPDGRVQSFRGAKNGVTFTGLHLLTREVLNWIPEEETFSSIVTAYESAMTTGRAIEGVIVSDSFWADTGTHTQYLDVHEATKDWSEATNDVNGWRSVEQPADLDDHVRLNKSIVWTGVQIHGSRTFTDAIITPVSDILDGVEENLFSDARWIEHLPIRGSDRSYMRLGNKERTAILVRSGEARPENERTASHTSFLEAAGLRVPQVLGKAPKRLLLEDCGTVNLLQINLGQPEVLGRVLHQVARLHSEETAAHAKHQSLEGPFDETLYRWEQDLFRDKFLKTFHPEVDPDSFVDDFAWLRTTLQAQVQRLLHRDLQASNVLWHKGEAVLIDFQGMRFGAQAYDLGSLFADPYVMRSIEEQKILLAAYNAVTDSPVDWHVYCTGTVQRLLQALGAYGRLGTQPGTERFLQHIPGALHQLGCACREIGTLPTLQRVFGN